MAAFSLPAAVNSATYLFGNGRPVEIPFGPVIEDEKVSFFGRDAELLPDAIIDDIGDAMRFVEAQSGRGRITSEALTDTQTWTIKWLFALGAVHWGGDGEYEASNSCAKLRLKYWNRDPYDFETNDSTLNGTVTSGQFRRLHDVGLAHEYLIFGSTPDITIEWQKGHARPLQRTEIDFRIGGRFKL